MRLQHGSSSPASVSSTTSAFAADHPEAKASSAPVSPITAPSPESHRRMRTGAADQVRRCASASPLRAGVSAAVRRALETASGRLRSDDFAWLRRRLVAEITALDTRDVDGVRPIDGFLRQLAEGAPLFGDDAETATGRCAFDPSAYDLDRASIQAEDPAFAPGVRFSLARLAASRFSVVQVLTAPSEGSVLVRPIGDPRVALSGFRAQAGALQVAIDDLRGVRLGSVIAGHLLPSTPMRAAFGRAADAKVAGMARFSSAAIVFRPDHRAAVHTLCASHPDDVVALRAALFALHVDLEVAAEHQDDLDELATMDHGSLIALWPVAALLRCGDRMAFYDAVIDHWPDEADGDWDYGMCLMLDSVDLGMAEVVFDDGEIWVRGNEDAVAGCVERLLALPGVELAPVAVAASLRDIEALDVAMLRDLPS